MSAAAGRRGAAGPANDAEVPAYVCSLGLPGLVDVHVHFLPPSVERKVWAFFDEHAADYYGMPWPIHYRTGIDERLATLRALGVQAFTGLVYPHKPGMAAWLNEWARDFAAQTDGCVPSGTFYPEPAAPTYVREALAAGARVFKVHVQVGGFDPRDALLDDVWGLLAQTGTPVITHCGSGPATGAFTGPDPISEVLARHPSLRLVVAHMGMPEYAAFLDLAESHANVHLDTTMAFTDFVEARMPFPPSLRSRLLALGDKIVLGSDFPTIPYGYHEQVSALARLDLGEDWLRAVLHDNGARLLGLPARTGAAL